MESLICPNAENCKFYQVWSKQNDTSVLDVIRQEGDYYCIALDTFARRRGPLLNDDSGLKKLVSNLFTVGCYNIELLNNSKKL